MMSEITVDSLRTLSHRDKPCAFPVDSTNSEMMYNKFPSISESEAEDKIEASRSG